MGERPYNLLEIFKLVKKDEKSIPNVLSSMSESDVLHIHRALDLDFVNYN